MAETQAVVLAGCPRTKFPLQLTINRKQPAINRFWFTQASIPRFWQFLPEKASKVVMKCSFLEGCFFCSFNLPALMEQGSVPLDIFPTKHHPPGRVFRQKPGFHGMQPPKLQITRGDGSRGLINLQFPSNSSLWLYDLGNMVGDNGCCTFISLR